MKKIVLVDGNNLIFRSYYATAYSGNTLKNSKGFPTNAIYGFLSMINKIIAEEKPTYMAVAFDIGKNFRWEKYKDYKAGRIATPEELKMQMPIAKDLLKAMGIMPLEKEMYEADDIIGTITKMTEDDPDFASLIVSSDKDLLQLISDETEMKLLKMKDYIRYNPKSFKEEWGIDPIKIIDLKAIAGDHSDNIPGVNGIGDKGALKLLMEYGSLENIYDNIDKIIGKTKEKLINDKDNAFFSKELATIYKDVPLDISLEDLKIKDKDVSKIKEIYEDLEFYSLLSSLDVKEDNKKKDISYEELKDISKLNSDKYALYIELDNENYHDANIIKICLADKDHNYIVSNDILKDVLDKIKDKEIYTYDAKKHYVILGKLNIDINFSFDLMIASYLLEENIKDDISYLMLNHGIDIDLYDQIRKKKFEVNLDEIDSLKSRFIYDVKDEYISKLEKEEMINLYNDIELPLAKVLSSMEIEGVKVNRNTLDEMKVDIKERIDSLTNLIYELAGEEFNINSPKQLGVILFEKLGLSHGKGNKTGYKTDASSLQKIVNEHPIIEKILEYRNLNKLYTTYLEGLEPYIKEDGKIHTIYKQTLTRTGRLSSVEPNLQNIPTRQEEGKKIRKAFVPSKDIFVSIDYSQIELRLLAHIADAKELQQAFIDGVDIHTKVAADINGKDIKDVTKKERSYAKAVIFGIIYGISGFGLGENLNITPKEAKAFIDKYYELYPSVKQYMDNIIKSAHENNVVRTMFNRKRTIDELTNKNYMIRQAGERIALNTPIQGTCADILKLAMVRIAKELEAKGLKSKMILQIHDELVFDCLEEEKDTVIKIAKEIMENVIKLNVPLRADASFGTDWYEAK